MAAAVERFSTRRSAIRNSNASAPAYRSPDPAFGCSDRTLIHWGTPAQKQRHLRRILAGEELCCQGYSEPNAGSDLAALQTRAIEKDGYFVVNGSTIWTSLAHHAHWMFLLARTDSDAPKHKGISYLLLDMKTPGITISPLIQMTGARHFNQVFFEVSHQRCDLLR
jgi:alkylation response protein AidB-like acyl-CoA dehydrogenase